MNDEERIDWIATANADQHEQSYCSHLDPEARARVWAVMYDHSVAAIWAFIGSKEDATHKYPMTFSVN